MISFFESFHFIVRNHRVEKIGIKKRSLKAKGKYASGPITFKMEGLIQLCKDADVLLISPNTISSKIKNNLPPDVNIFKYQTEAYQTAYTVLRLAQGSS